MKNTLRTAAAILLYCSLAAAQQNCVPFEENGARWWKCSDLGPQSPWPGDTGLPFGGTAAGDIVLRAPVTKFVALPLPDDMLLLEHYRQLTAAQDREIAALREAVAAREKQIVSLGESIEAWKKLVGAKKMSRGDKLKLGLSVAGSLAAVVGTVIGR